MKSCVCNSYLSHTFKHTLSIYSHHPLSSAQAGEAFCDKVMDQQEPAELVHTVISQGNQSI